MRILLGVVLLMTVLTACAAKSPLPPGMEAQPQVLVTPQVVAADPKPYLRQTVRWGGRVVGVALEEQHSVMEVLQYDLTSRGRPIPSDSPGGRFIVVFPGLLDPAVYAAGREVTVVGEIHSVETRLLGQQPYNYPMVTSNQVHLWPVRVPVQVYDPWYDPWDSWGSDSYYHPRVRSSFSIGFGFRGR